MAKYQLRHVHQGVIGHCGAVCAWEVGAIISLRKGGDHENNNLIGNPVVTADIRPGATERNISRQTRKSVGSWSDNGGSAHTEIQAAM